MSIVLTIDSNTIEDSDIKNYPTSKSRVVSGRNLIGSEANIVLDNTDGTYSDTSTSSIFYASNWLDKAVTIYDDVQEIYTWTGRIKNITVKDSNRTVVVKTVNYIRELSDVTCVYTTTGVTPSAAVYYILNTVVGISTAFLNLPSFTDAANTQTGASATLNITFASKDNKKCMSVVNELLRLSQCHIYTVDNIIYIEQWAEWDGQLGYVVDGDKYLSATLETEYEEQVYNAYSIAYNNAGTAAYATGTVGGTDGDKVFGVPDESPGTTSASFRIIYANSTGAAWAGALANTRYANPVKLFKCQLDYNMSYLLPMDQIDLYFSDYIREPVRITDLTNDPNRRKISVSGYFLNLPVNVQTRDIEPPAKVDLVQALPMTNGVFLKWSKSVETDHLGYSIYFTAGEPGNWRQELSNYGQSPVEIKNPSTTPDGYAYVTIYGLNPGTRYYFKVTSFDTSYNESADSGELSAIPFSGADNLYMLAGTVYGGLTLDNNNALGGTIISGYTTYGDGVYGTVTYQPCAFYQSPTLASPTTFGEWSFRGTGDTNDIQYQYRTSTDNVTWTAWSTAADAIGTTKITLTKKYIEYRYIFNSTGWNDTDTIYTIGLT